MSQDFGPISTGVESGTAPEAGIKLFARSAATAFQDDALLGATGASKACGVVKTRANARFLNKFTTHGNRGRSATTMSKVIALLLVLLKQQSPSYNDIMFKGLFVLDKVCTASQNHPRAITIGSAHELLQFLRQGGAMDLAGLHSTDYIYKFFSQAVPHYSYVPKRIDKQRYKNARGRAGRYELVLKKIERSSSLSHVFKFFKIH